MNPDCLAWGGEWATLSQTAWCLAGPPLTRRRWHRRAGSRAQPSLQAPEGRSLWQRHICSEPCEKDRPWGRWLFSHGANDNWAESAHLQNTVQPLALGIPRDTTPNSSPRGYPRHPVGPILGPAPQVSYSKPLTQDPHPGPHHGPPLQPSYPKSP